MEKITRELFPDIITAKALESAHKIMATEGKCTFGLCEYCFMNREHMKVDLNLCSDDARRRFANPRESLKQYTLRIATEYLELVDPKTIKLNLTE